LEGHLDPELIQVAKLYISQIIFGKNWPKNCQHLNCQEIKKIGILIQKSRREERAYCV
jgi:hypothetical protein